MSEMFLVWGSLVGLVLWGVYTWGHWIGWKRGALTQVEIGGKVIGQQMVEIKILRLRHGDEEPVELTLEEFQRIEEGEQRYGFYDPELGRHLTDEEIEAEAKIEEMD